MVDTADKFNTVIYSYKELREEMPQASEAFIKDYMLTKQNLVDVADTNDEVNDGLIIEANIMLGLRAQFDELNQRVGSGVFLTGDETGFTGDTTKIYGDREQV